MRSKLYCPVHREEMRSGKVMPRHCLGDARPVRLRCRREDGIWAYEIRTHTAGRWPASVFGIQIAAPGCRGSSPRSKILWNIGMSSVSRFWTPCWFCLWSTSAPMLRQNSCARPKPAPSRGYGRFKSEPTSAAKQKWGLVRG